MLIGYMRVSTGEQNLDLQRDALDRAGCGRVFDDVCSGRATERAGLDKALDIMRDGDTLVVWKLDRIGRSLPHVVGLVGDLQKRGIGLKVLTGDIDCQRRSKSRPFGGVKPGHRVTCRGEWREGVARGHSPRHWCNFQGLVLALRARLCARR